MTGKEYCENCCKKEVCFLREKLSQYVDESNDLIKSYEELKDVVTNDIRCRYCLSKVLNQR